MFRTTDAIKAEYPELPALETYDELLAEFQQAFGPQTAYAADGSSPWEWVQGAWPWQNDTPDGGRR